MNTTSPTSQTLLILADALDAYSFDKEVALLRAVAAERDALRAALTEIGDARNLGLSVAAHWMRDAAKAALEAHLL